jgi:hypothetical protein
MKKERPSSLVKVCPKCDRFYGLQAEDDHYFPVHKTDDLTKCPECQTPLEDPQMYHYLLVNKRAAAEAKAKKDTRLETLLRENSRLKAENESLRKTIFQFQETSQQKNNPPTPSERKCIECGRSFSPKLPTHEFCSVACRTKSNNRKRRERREVQRHG